MRGVETEQRTAQLMPLARPHPTPAFAGGFPLRDVARGSCFVGWFAMSDCVESTDSGATSDQLGGGGANPTSTLAGKAWQRQIRDQRKRDDSDADMFGRWWEGIDTNIGLAEVRPVTYHAAADIIHKYEWLGNMGTTEYSFGIFWQNYMAGAVCFGDTAGTNVYASVCGEQYASRAITLCRGACVHWAHPHAASKLINRACRMLSATHGYQIFIAYSDPEAGEIGTVYQACGWMYCGMTSATEKFRLPDGSVKDARLVHAYTRDRRGGTLKYTHSRAEQKRRMIEAGAEFFMGTPKHRYVNIVGPDSPAIKSLIRWPRGPYPKRDTQNE